MEQQSRYVGFGLVTTFNGWTVGVVIIVEEETINTLRKQQPHGKEARSGSSISDRKGGTAIQLQTNRHAASITRAGQTGGPNHTTPDAMDISGYGT